MSQVHVNILHKDRVLTCGEGPVWLDDSGEWGFIDFLRSKFIKIDYQTNDWNEVIVPGVSCMSLSHPTTKANRFIGLCGKEVIAYDWENPGGYKILARVEENKNVRFNDGTADRSGRLWAGTMGEQTSPGVVPKGLGSLYVMDIGSNGEYRSPKRASTKPVDLSNGMDFSVNNDKMFYVDSVRRVVYIFNYDADSGSLNNQRVAIDFKNFPDSMNIGLPDGCTIDVDDKLWVACYLGSSICRFDVEKGKIIERVTFDADRITSCVFGGPQLNQLFVTSDNPPNGNGAAIYRVDGLSVPGFQTNRVNAPEM